VSVEQALLSLQKKYGGDAPRVVVSYDMDYAVYVHEDLEAHHLVGQAKFLEEPARQKADEIAAVVVKALGEGKTMEDAFMEGGLFLQAESQKLCPVDTGALRASANTRLEG
jgi:hypothetical protein